MIKKVLSIITAILLLQTSVNALNIPKQDESIYVNDFAFVLSEETEKQLITMNQNSDYDTGGYVVVATFDFVDEDLYDFSYRLFNEWEIGSEEYNNGILLVLDIGNDNYCYIMGTGIEQYISDSEAWDIIDRYMEPDFAIKDYDQAVLKTTSQFLNIIEKNFSIEDEVIVDNKNEGSIFAGLFGIFGLLSFINDSFMIILFIIIVIFIIRTISKSKRNNYSSSYHRPTFRPTYKTYRDPFKPRPNRDFNDYRGTNFSNPRPSSRPSSSSRPSFSSSRPSSSSSSRTHHSGGRSRGAGGTRR